MLWEVELWPKDRNPDHERVCADYDLLTHSSRGREVFESGSRGYLVDAHLTTEQDRVRLVDLLSDPIVDWVRMDRLNAEHRDRPGWVKLTVLPKPGVMDPVAESVVSAARDLGLAVKAVRTFRRYQVRAEALATRRDLCRKVLANDAIEQVVEGTLPEGPLTVGTPYTFHKVTVPLRNLDNPALEKLSRDGQLALTLDEMRAIQAQFRELARDPTDVELETLAQTWSEHCSHKTLKGRIEIDGRVYDNLLKDTIFAATQEVRKRLGADDWCVSVFEDNAGVVKFDENNHVCFKVETHNRPSAIEPYGGANTGLGGVIRDVLGVGLGAKPICNTDVFCFAPADFPPEELPPGVLHPRKVIQGVVAGVRDYGNRMGIPTVNGAVLFDERYLANPLVFCGTVGVMPVGAERKAAQPGDLIVAIGGRTGRDGIHGATFSSLGLHDQSEAVSGGAVQIGHAIHEKKLLDVLLAARDRGLYHAVTDCGAGGFSSAIGEMGAELGAVVDLDKAPLKYEGLSYTEIWISEAQERMVLAVPPDKWPELQALCGGEDVEATALGTFEKTGRLRLRYQDEEVADLAMAFLHDGRPKVICQSRERKRAGPGPLPLAHARGSDFNAILKSVLASPSVASKEWIIRQYDHEVQGGTVLKPLVGANGDGPGDAAVILPLLGSHRGLAVGCGINPWYGDLDPYAMAAAVIDEAVRNVVAVGADPSRIALLDNFCWGNVNDPETLGGLVRAAEACRDVAIAYGMPFISGKDSLNNEYRSAERTIKIPGTLLISALGQVPDVRRCVSMDLKSPGHVLYLVGETRDELGGSHYNRVTGQTGGEPPRLNLDRAPKLFRALHAAITQGLVRSCHDLSEGGLAVALAEIAFAGNVGADISYQPEVRAREESWLFSESPTRWVVEVTPVNVAAVEAAFAELPLIRLGTTTAEPRLRIAGKSGEWIIWAPLKELKAAWQNSSY
ncbi:MAG TPA: phosphoribosylformylglycinamidine synthase subunit PurL [Gemmataceae bacterium]|nr:phosphoribosylformylglycinamidine synthase subunit PurL [Gemmataceae bacterium]